MFLNTNDTYSPQGKNNLPTVSGGPLILVSVSHNLGFTESYFLFIKKCTNSGCKVIRSKRTFIHS